MSPEDLKAARHELGLSVSGLSILLGLSPKSGTHTIREYERGARPITGPVAAAVRAFLLLNEIDRWLEIDAWTSDPLLDGPEDIREKIGAVIGDDIKAEDA